MTNQLKERDDTLSFVIKNIFYQHPLNNYAGKLRALQVTFADPGY